MNALVVVGPILVGLVLVAAGVILLWALLVPRRKRSAAEPTRPKTVADLVRLRAEAGELPARAAATRKSGRAANAVQYNAGQANAGQANAGQANVGADNAVAGTPRVVVSEEGPGEHGDSGGRSSGAAPRSTAAQRRRMRAAAPVEISRATADAEATKMSTLGVEARDPGPSVPEPGVVEQEPRDSVFGDDTPWRRAARIGTGNAWATLVEDDPPTPSPGDEPWIPPEDVREAVDEVDPSGDAAAVEESETSPADAGEAPSRAAEWIDPALVARVSRATGAPPPARSAERQGDAPRDAAGAGLDGGPVISRTRRVRPTQEERAAEQAAADLALLRTFGFVDPSPRSGGASVVAMARPEVEAPSTADGNGRPVRFRSVRRDGAAVDGAAVTLLDDRGNEVVTTRTGPDGRGEVVAPAEGSYVLVSTAPGHQPGAAAITVGADPVDVEVLLTRSASVSGTVRDEDGLIADARVTLVQDQEIVESADTDEAGAYRIGDIGAGEYELSVVAAGYARTVTVLEVADEADLRHDVELGSAAPVNDGIDPDMSVDAMSGQR